MLVSGKQWTKHRDVTYRVSRIVRIVRSSCVSVQFVLSSETCICATVFSLSLPPSLVDLVSLGLVSISTDLLSVTVSGGWLPLSELPWIPACPARGSFFALEPPPALIPKLIYWR